MSVIKYKKSILVLILIGFSNHIFTASKTTKNHGFISYIRAELDANPRIKTTLKIAIGLCACVGIAKLALSYKQITNKKPHPNTQKPPQEKSTAQTKHEPDLNIKNMNPVNTDRIIITQGNITNLHGNHTKQGAVVSAANAANGLTWTYQKGGGIANAIGKAAGLGLLQDDKIKNKYIKPGEAIATYAYELADRYTTIIHVAGPDCRIKNQNENRQQLLYNAYTNAFNAAGASGAQRVILPSISTGVFGYHNFNEAATIAIQCAREALTNWPVIEQVIFVLGDDNVHRAFAQIL